MSSIDPFIGAWNVDEALYASSGERLGTLRQQRRLYLDDDAKGIVVKQTCAPSAQLDGHPMAAFRGEFAFTLRKEGRHRHYLGPDVLGGAIGLGDCLFGRGVWPRFGYNFRSWSLSLGEREQVTGGTFWRGAEAVAVICGRGRQGEPGSAQGAPDVLFEAVNAEGRRWHLALDDEVEERSAVARRVLSAEQWVEYGPSHEEHFRLDGHGTDLILRRNGRAVGMAKRYGPLLHWECYDEHGLATIAVDGLLADCGVAFSLRQHLLYGRLISLEGLRFTT